MLKAVIFDLDGVIIDSEPLMRFAFGACYREVIGEGTPPIEDYLQYMGESFPRIMDKLGLPHTLWKPFRELCQQHIDQIRLFPESRSFIEQVLALNMKTAILTGKDRERTVQILEHFDLRRFFHAVVASDQLRNPKPDPEGMFYTLRLLDCAAEEALMIGDSVSDILCAQRAGVTAVAVTWGIKPERVQTLCQPNYIAHSWAGLSQILLRRADEDRVVPHMAAIAPLGQYVD